MTKLKFINYQRYELISIFLSVSVWISLGTFTIMTKSNLSLNLITFLEAAIFITSIMGIHMAFKKVGSYRLYVMLNIIIETKEEKYEKDIAVKLAGSDFYNSMREKTGSGS